MNKNKIKIIKFKMSKKTKYDLIKFLEIRFADPISSMKLVNNYFVYGTLMGRLNLYNIKEDKKIQLSELNPENISDIAYNEKERKFLAGIGDEEIKIFYIDTLSEDTIPQNQSFNVYLSDFDHTKNCENAFIFITDKSFLRVQLPQIEEGNIKIIKMESNYEVKYFNEEDEIYQKSDILPSLPTTNYTVPFDFNGKQFLWVEFLSATERNICITNIPLLKTDRPYKYGLNNTIGHISQAKILPNNRVFIVHTLNKCEIRNLDKDFTLLEKFEHIGEEVLAVDVYIYDENENILSNNELNENIYKNDYIKEISPKKNKKLLSAINTNTNRRLETSDNQQKNKNQKEFYDNNNEYLTIKQNKLMKNGDFVDIKNICIATLDIDGNINLYKNKKEINLFNLNNIDDIPQDHKDKNFFSMGYAYYMKTDLNYYCISSDHGCYIIKANN